MLAQQMPSLGKYYFPSRTRALTQGRYKPKPYDFIRSYYAVLNRWQSETRFLSDPDEITDHSSFHALVQNARVVLPFILEDLRLQPSFLVWVLEDAFPDDIPYNSHQRGNIRVMSQAWYSWGERNGRTLSK